MSNRFETLGAEFVAHFAKAHFPAEPASLYHPAEYFLGLGGKRIRPVLALLGAELFAPLTADAWTLATAVEMFHNFTLVHDDIMDKAPLRRGKATVHEKFGMPSALLAGDVMLVKVYDYLNRIDHPAHRDMLSRFNRMAAEVCEGQQLDMDFEAAETVSLKAYLHMIEMKTAVLLSAALETGAMLSDAPAGDIAHLGAFGRNLGLAFQVQDDYLDAFGDPEKFGKQPGGDILAGKKTFLLVSALEAATAGQAKEIRRWLATGDCPDKVPAMLDLFRACGADALALTAQEAYATEAARRLDAVSVPEADKRSLRELAAFLMQRQS